MSGAKVFSAHERKTKDEVKRKCILLYMYHVMLPNNSNTPALPSLIRLPSPNSSKFVVERRLSEADKCWVGPQQYSRNLITRVYWWFECLRFCAGEKPGREAKKCSTIGYLHVDS